MKADRMISLVIPAYKQEKTIVHNIYHVNDVLKTLPYRYEIIVVVDGFLDKTFQNAKKIQQKNVKIFGYQQNHGKGYAVKYGMLEGKGDIIGFLDAGMDLQSIGIASLIDKMIRDDADIIIGSKLHSESKVNYPKQRWVISLGYRALIKLLFGLNVSDTQVGMKFFKREVVKDVFPRLLVKAYAVDIEMLAVSRELGYTKIEEGPVELNFNKASSITSKSFLTIIFWMLWDTFAVFYRLKILHYYTNKNSE